MDLKDIQAVKQRFGIIGLSSALNRAIDTAVQVANTDLSVLIQGESGVGKENFPQIIHLKALSTPNSSDTKKVLSPVPHPTAKATSKKPTEALSSSTK